MFKRRACEQIAVLASSPWLADKEGKGAEGLVWISPSKIRGANECTCVSFRKDSELNPEGKPARGSFEITVERDDGKKVLVWSGLKRGPPRKEKFPDSSVLLKETYDKLTK